MLRVPGARDSSRPTCAPVIQPSSSLLVIGEIPPLGLGARTAGPLPSLFSCPACGPDAVVVAFVLSDLTLFLLLESTSSNVAPTRTRRQAPCPLVLARDLREASERPQFRLSRRHLLKAGIVKDRLTAIQPDDLATGRGHANT